MVFPAHPCRFLLVEKLLIRQTLSIPQLTLVIRLLASLSLPASLSGAASDPPPLSEALQRLIKVGLMVSCLMQGDLFFLH